MPTNDVTNTVSFKIGENEFLVSESAKSYLDSLSNNGYDFTNEDWYIGRDVTEVVIVMFAISQYENAWQTIMKYMTNIDYSKIFASEFFRFGKTEDCKDIYKYLYDAKYIDDVFYNVINVYYCGELFDEDFYKEVFSTMTAVEMCEYIYSAFSFVDPDNKFNREPIKIPSFLMNLLISHPGNATDFVDEYIIGSKICIAIDINIVKSLNKAGLINHNKSNIYASLCYALFEQKENECTCEHDDECHEVFAFDDFDWEFFINLTGEELYAVAEKFFIEMNYSSTNMLLSVLSYLNNYADMDGDGYICNAIILNTDKFYENPYAVAEFVYKHTNIGDIRLNMDYLIDKNMHYSYYMKSITRDIYSTISIFDNYIIGSPMYSDRCLITYDMLNKLKVNDTVYHLNKRDDLTKVIDQFHNALVISTEMDITNPEYDYIAMLKYTYMNILTEFIHYSINDDVDSTDDLYINWGDFSRNGFKMFNYLSMKSDIQNFYNALLNRDIILSIPVRNDDEVND